MRERPKPSTWSVYLLRCADGTLYCGVTNDIDRRLVAHGRGGVKYTLGRLPVKLAHLEPAGDRGAALRREAAVKRLPRREKLSLVAAMETINDAPPTCAKAPNSLLPIDVESSAPRPRASRNRLR